MAEETKDTGMQDSNEPQARIDMLEQGIASKDSELAAARGTLAGAVAKYRAVLLVNSPGVPEELVKGDTVEEIDASLQQAHGIVARVRQQLEAEAETNEVPTPTKEERATRIGGWLQFIASSPAREDARAT